MKKNNPKISIILVILIISCFLILTQKSVAADKIITKIIVLVNDTPITFRDFVERAKYNRFNSPNKTSLEIRDISMNELVNETLKIQESGENFASYSQKQIRDTLSDKLSQKGHTYETYKVELAKNNIDITTIENQMRASLNWNRFINSKFRKLINVTLNEIKEYDDTINANTIYSIKKITLISKSQSINKLLEEATTINYKFENCEEGIIGLEEKDYINVEEIKNITLSEIQEPIKSMIKSSKENTMLPPHIVSNNIELIAVCSIGKNKKNNNTKEIIINSQLENFSSKHMRDLHSDSIIEYKINE